MRKSKNSPAKQGSSSLPRSASTPQQLNHSASNGLYNAYGLQSSSGQDDESVSNSVQTDDTFTSSVRSSFKNLFDPHLSKSYHHYRNNWEERPAKVQAPKPVKKSQPLYPSKDISFLSDEIIKQRSKKELSSKWFHEDSIYKMRNFNMFDSNDDPVLQTEVQIKRSTSKPAGNLEEESTDTLLKYSRSDLKMLQNHNLKNKYKQLLRDPDEDLEDDEKEKEKHKSYDTDDRSIEPGSALEGYSSVIDAREIQAKNTNEMDLNDIISYYKLFLAYYQNNMNTIKITKLKLLYPNYQINLLYSNLILFLNSMKDILKSLVVKVNSLLLLITDNYNNNIKYIKYFSNSFLLLKYNRIIGLNFNNHLMGVDKLILINNLIQSLSTNVSSSTFLKYSDTKKSQTETLPLFSSSLQESSAFITSTSSLSTSSPYPQLSFFSTLKYLNLSNNKLDDKSLSLFLSTIFSNYLDDTVLNFYKKKNTRKAYRNPYDDNEEEEESSSEEEEEIDEDADEETQKELSVFQDISSIGLVYLNLSFNTVGPLTLTVLQKYIDSNYCRIETLILDNCSLSDEIAGNLIESLQKLNSLKQLSMSNNNIGISTNSLAYGSSNSSSSSSTVINVVIKKWKNFFNYHNNIQFVDLSSNFITSNLCNEIFFSLKNNPNILYLNLSYNKITNQNAYNIGLSLMSNTTLQYLNLSKNIFTSTGALSIVYLSIFNPSSAIKFIDISDNTINHMTARFLSKFLINLNKRSLQANSEIIKKSILEYKAKKSEDKNNSFLDSLLLSINQSIQNNSQSYNLSESSSPNNPSSPEAKQKLVEEISTDENSSNNFYSSIKKVSDRIGVKLEDKTYDIRSVHVAFSPSKSTSNFNDINEPIEYEESEQDIKEMRINLFDINGYYHFNCSDLYSRILFYVILNETENNSYGEIKDIKTFATNSSKNYDVIQIVRKYPESKPFASISKNTPSASAPRTSLTKKKTAEVESTSAVDFSNLGIKELTEEWIVSLKSTDKIKELTLLIFDRLDIFINQDYLTLLLNVISFNLSKNNSFPKSSLYSIIFLLDVYYAWINHSQNQHEFQKDKKEKSELDISSLIKVFNNLNLYPFYFNSKSSSMTNYLQLILPYKTNILTLVNSYPLLKITLYEMILSLFNQYYYNLILIKNKKFNTVTQTYTNPYESLTLNNSQFIYHILNTKVFDFNLKKKSYPFIYFNSGIAYHPPETGSIEFTIYNPNISQVSEKYWSFNPVQNKIISISSNIRKYTNKNSAKNEPVENDLQVFLLNSLSNFEIYLYSFTCLPSSNFLTFYDHFLLHVNSSYENIYNLTCLEAEVIMKYIVANNLYRDKMNIILKLLYQICSPRERVSFIKNNLVLYEILSLKKKLDYHYNILFDSLNSFYIVNLYHYSNKFLIKYLYNHNLYEHLYIQEHFQYINEIRKYYIINKQSPKQENNLNQIHQHLVANNLYYLYPKSSSISFFLNSSNPGASVSLYKYDTSQSNNFLNFRNIILNNENFHQLNSSFIYDLPKYGRLKFNYISLLSPCSEMIQSSNFNIYNLGKESNFSNENITERTFFGINNFGSTLSNLNEFNHNNYNGSYTYSDSVSSDNDLNTQKDSISTNQVNEINHLISFIFSTYIFTVNNSVSNTMVDITSNPSIIDKWEASMITSKISKKTDEDDDFDLEEDSTTIAKSTQLIEDEYDAILPLNEIIYDEEFFSNPKENLNPISTSQTPVPISPNTKLNFRAQNSSLSKSTFYRLQDESEDIDTGVRKAFLVHTRSNEKEPGSDETSISSFILKDKNKKETNRTYILNHFFNYMLTSHDIYINNYTVSYKKKTKQIFQENQAELSAVYQANHGTLLHIPSCINKEQYPNELYALSGYSELYKLNSLKTFQFCKDALNNTQIPHDDSHQVSSLPDLSNIGKFFEIELEDLYYNFNNILNILDVFLLYYPVITTFQLGLIVQSFVEKNAPFFIIVKLITKLFPKLNDQFNFSSFFINKLLNNNKYFTEITHRLGYLNSFSLLLPHGKFFFELNINDHTEFLNIFLNFIRYLYRNKIEIYINSLSFTDLFSEEPLVKESKKKESYSFSLTTTANSIPYYDFSVYITAEYRQHIFLPWKPINLFTPNFVLPKNGHLKLKISDNFTQYYYHLTSIPFTSTNLNQIFSISSINTMSATNQSHTTNSPQPSAAEIKSSFLSQLNIRKKFFVDNCFNMNYNLVLNDLLSNFIK